MSKKVSTFSGVRQGENLSPLLFALFLNDLTSFLSTNYDGLASLGNDINEQRSNNDLEIFQKLCILLYADDTIILAESPVQLQRALDGMDEYCHKNKLKVNETKTKIVFFSRGKIRKLPTFKFHDSKLEVVHSYTYLGVTFNYNGKLKMAQKDVYDKASRAMFGLIAKCRRLKLPIYIQMKLFDNVVKPIMLYGCDVWGLLANDIRH